MFTRVYNLIEFELQFLHQPGQVGLSFGVIMTKSAFVEKSLESGQEVWLAFKSTAVKVIEQKR
jgi:hypothetical protein